MSRARLEEGQELMKKAEKLCATSVLALRFKPDWQASCPLFEQAAQAFRAAKAWDQAIKALERAAQAQERQGSPWHAAKDLEAAALCAKEAKRSKDVMDYSRRAAEMFLEASRPSNAADSLRKGGKMLEDLDPPTALKLVMEGLDMMETQQDSGPRNPDMYTDAVTMAVRAGQWDSAADALLRYGAVCAENNTRGSLTKCYLGAIVVHLHAGKAREAWNVYQDVLGVDLFMSSDGAEAAEALFNAYRTGEAEQVRECVKGSSVFTYGLDNAVGRLAKKLPVGDLRAQAASLPGYDVTQLSSAMGDAAMVGTSGSGVEAELDDNDLT